MDTKSYDNALISAMREAPDLLMIGEIRDRPTLQSAMLFAQTGHLCLSTLHANNSYHALNRIINFFPREARDALLADLSISLRCVVSQRLVRAKSGGGPSRGGGSRGRRPSFVSSQPRRKNPAAPRATVKTLVDAVYSRLSRARVAFGHGTTNAWDEAVYLVLHALRLPLDELVPVLECKVSAAGRRRALRLVDARIRRRVPAAYLTREAWLGDYRFYVDARALVPRSFIAELLRERLAPWLARRRILRALDLCTGSGCLAVTLGTVFSMAHGHARGNSRPRLAGAPRHG